MLTKFLSMISFIFGAFGLGAIFGASIAFLGYSKDIENSGYEWGIRKTKETEKNVN